jgi:hypothetical protein
MRNEQMVAIRNGIQNNSNVLLKKAASKRKARVQGFPTEHTESNFRHKRVKARGKSRYYSVHKWHKVETSAYLDCLIAQYGGQGSSVRIAIGYGLEGPGIESRWGKIFRTRPDRPLGPKQPPVQWVSDLSRGWSGRGVVLTTHPLLARRSRMSRSITLLPLWALRGLL